VNGLHRVTPTGHVGSEVADSDDVIGGRQNAPEQLEKVQPLAGRPFQAPVEQVEPVYVDEGPLSPLGSGWRGHSWKSESRHRVSPATAFGPVAKLPGSNAFKMSNCCPLVKGSLVRFAPR